MHPILFYLGDSAVHSYGVMGALGFLAVCWVSLTRGTLEGVDREKTADILFWTSLAGLLGSRVLFILVNPSFFSGPADWINLRTGGLVFYGAFLAGIPAASFLMWRHQLSFFQMWDIFATAMPLGHAISRFGCFLAGCCYGRPTDLPWGITFTDDRAVAPLGTRLHPTQLYELSALLTIFAIVNLTHAKRRFQGQSMLLYLGLYAVARTGSEFFRADPTRGWFMESVLGRLLSTSQALSLLVGAAALVVFLGVARAKSRAAK